MKYALEINHSSGLLNGKRSFILYYTIKNYVLTTAQKMIFSVKGFVSICEQIRSSSHLLSKSLMENFIFCAGKRLVNSIARIM